MLNAPVCVLRLNELMVKKLLALRHVVPNKVGTDKPKIELFYATGQLVVHAPFSDCGRIEYEMRQGP